MACCHLYRSNVHTDSAKISTVLETLKDQLTNGPLAGDIGISLSRIAKGYALAVVVGILLGVLMGMNKSANRFFMLTFTAIRQIPMIAWVPILIIWFGIGEESKVAVIFLAAYFPVLVNTVSGIERTDPKLIEVGKMYHLNDGSSLHRFIFHLLFLLFL